jgi:hypothetical protein
MILSYGTSRKQQTPRLKGAVAATSIQHKLHQRYSQPKTLFFREMSQSSMYLEPSSKIFSLTYKNNRTWFLLFLIQHTNTIFLKNLKNNALTLLQCTPCVFRLGRSTGFRLA